MPRYIREIYLMGIVRSALALVYICNTGDVIMYFLLVQLDRWNFCQI